MDAGSQTGHDQQQSRMSTGTTLRTDLPKRLCRIGIGSTIGAGYLSTIFDLYGIEYSQVCGKIIGYQDWTPDAFGQKSLLTSIDSAYVDGISLTHGRNPRKHIWTFAAGLDEVGSRPTYDCPCTNKFSLACNTTTIAVFCISNVF